MLAPTTRLVDPWRAVAESVLKDEGITLDELQIPGVRRPAFGEAWRPLYVFAERFTMSAPVPDELSKATGRLKCVVTFDLPRGAYATVLLRALGA